MERNKDFVKFQMKLPLCRKMWAKPSREKYLHLVNLVLGSGHSFLFITLFLLSSGSSITWMLPCKSLGLRYFSQ